MVLLVVWSGTGDGHQGRYAMFFCLFTDSARLCRAQTWNWFMHAHKTITAHWYCVIARQMKKTPAHWQWSNAPQGWWKWPTHCRTEAGLPVLFLSTRMYRFWRQLVLHLFDQGPVKRRTRNSEGFLFIRSRLRINERVIQQACTNSIWSKKSVWKTYFLVERKKENTYSGFKRWPDPKVIMTGGWKASQSLNASLDYLPVHL